MKTQEWKTSVAPRILPLKIYLKILSKHVEKDINLLYVI